MGNYEQAERGFRKIQQEVSAPGYVQVQRTPFFRHRLAFVLWQTGRKEQALKLFNEQMEKDIESIALNPYTGGTSYYYDLAAVNAFLGNREKAYSWIDKMVAEGWGVGGFCMQDPLFDNLKSDQKFKELAAKVVAHRAQMRKNFKLMLEDPGLKVDLR